MLRGHLFVFLAVIGLSVGTMGMILSSYFYYQDSQDNEPYRATSCYISYTTATHCVTPCQPCRCIIATEFATPLGNFTFQETCYTQACIEKYFADVLPCWTIDNSAVTLTDPLTDTNKDLFLLFMFIGIFFIGLGMLLTRYLQGRTVPPEEEAPLIL